MKRRVRIYKAGGEANEPTQEQLIKAFIAEKMNADDYDNDTDVIKEELVQAGIDESVADQYIEEANDTYGIDDTLAEQEAAAAEAQARAAEQQAALDEQNIAEEEARKQMYITGNQDIINGVVADGIAGAEEEEVARYGGAKLSKRNFINQYTKFAKMAQGGDTPSPGAYDVLGGREQHVSNFFKGINESVNSAQQKQAAEEQYNAIYGNPQVGAYAQDGGINQEQVDFENPLHHLSTYGADTRHIFSDNMYTQNDIAALEQYGGNTGQGLYKFIGGGDNELIDEQYQDSDLDYQRYAKRGGSLYKYQGTDNSIVDVNKNGISDLVEAPEEDWRKKYEELIAQQKGNTNKSQEDMLRMLQTYLDQRGNQGNAGSPFNFGNKLFNRYNQAVNDPYYTQSSEKYAGPDLAGRTPTSTVVTKKGIFGRPKEYTVNYAGTPKISSFKAPTYTPGQSNTEMGQSEDTPYRGQSFGEKMMNTRIPGIKQLGQVISRYNTSPGEGAWNTNVPYAPEEEARMKKRDPYFRSFESKEDKEYGGPVDYTEYAYGGDVSIPELYRAQTGFETNADGCPWGSTKDYNGNCVDGQGNVTKKANTDFKLSEPEKLLENSFSQPKKNPLTGETPGIQVDSSGNYINEGIKYGDQEGVSQDFRNKQSLNLTGKDYADASLMVGNAVANQFENANFKKQQNQLLTNMTSPESAFGVNNGYDRGDYDPNSGLFRPNEMGFNGVSKYGGGVYATGGNIENEDEDTQYMTQEEIDDFIANGGELEYL